MGAKSYGFIAAESECVFFSRYINEEGVARKQPYEPGFHYRFGRNLSNIFF